MTTRSSSQAGETDGAAVSPRRAATATVNKPTKEDFCLYRVPVYGISNGEKVTGTHAEVLRWICTQGSAYQAATEIFFKRFSFIGLAERHYIGRHESQDAAIRRVSSLYDPLVMDGISRRPLRPVTHDLKIYRDRQDPPTHDQPEPASRRYISVVLPTYTGQRMMAYPSVRLADGRNISIADEHEDSHDPDFCIYNDVRVAYPENWHDSALAGTHDFYLYRPQDFPPTDFHTCDYYRSCDGANQIVVLGNLSQRQLRKPGHTPVYVLDCGTMQITQVDQEQSGLKNDLGGYGPGWISGHKTRVVDLETSEPIADYYATSKHHTKACHQDGTTYPFRPSIGIMVYGGRICKEDGFVSNRDRWVLDPETYSWNKLEPGHGVEGNSDDEEEDSDFATAREEHQMKRYLWNKLGSKKASEETQSRLTESSD